MSVDSSHDRGPELARALWQRIETLHAFTYFSPESIAGAKEAGLRGFWMGYFGFRAAPMGAVGPGPVEAAFANFHRSMVERAIPDAWSYASPDDLVATRAGAAAAALRGVVAGLDDVAARCVPLLGAVIDAADSLGRPLFAANRRVQTFDDPIAQLWQHCTTLREHRGDGHVATLAAHGIDGCEAHLLILAEHGTPPEVVFDHRGWTVADRTEASGRLRERGLLSTTAELELTDAGRSLRLEVEQTTDRLAGVPIRDALTDAEHRVLLDSLLEPAQTVAASGVIPFPNPMGLPTPTYER